MSEFLEAWNRSFFFPLTTASSLPSLESWSQLASGLAPQLSSLAWFPSQHLVAAKPETS